MSVYEDTEDVDQGNRVLLFCVGADVQRRREGANTAVKTRAILQLRGSKVTGSPSANNSCHPLLRGQRCSGLHPHSPRLPDTVPRLCRVCGTDPVLSSPWHPEGKCH